jgi:hypothetical protein
MKGHVGDGARSGELKAPVTGLYKPMPHLRGFTFAHGDACPFVSITFDSAGIGSLKLMPCGSAIFGSCLLGV